MGFFSTGTSGHMETASTERMSEKFRLEMRLIAGMNHCNLGQKVCKRPKKVTLIIWHKLKERKINLNTHHHPPNC